MFFSISSVFRCPNIHPHQVAFHCARIFLPSLLLKPEQQASYIGKMILILFLDALSSHTSKTMFTQRRLKSVWLCLTKVEIEDIFLLLIFVLLSKRKWCPVLAPTKKKKAVIAASTLWPKQQLPVLSQSTTSLNLRPASSQRKLAVSPRRWQLSSEDPTQLWSFNISSWWRCHKAASIMYFCRQTIELEWDRGGLSDDLVFVSVIIVGVFFSSFSRKV